MAEVFTRSCPARTMGIVANCFGLSVLEQRRGGAMREGKAGKTQTRADSAGVIKLDLPEMPSYNTEKRRSELRRLGLSEPIVRLAMFDPPDHSFRMRCGDVGPPCPEWHDQQPPGPPVSYLWQFQDTVTGVRIKSRWRNLIRSPLAFLKRRLEFIKFKPEALAAGCWIIAYHEQGLLANLFSDMIGDDQSELELCLSITEPTDPHRDQIEGFQRCKRKRAAQSVAFEYLEEIESFRHAHEHRWDYTELLAVYTRSIVAKSSRA
jgi:hypothetical protein